ncbi:Ionotropic receptor 113 [Halyomorpha halys]|nr:Ionotropic receptor 113 [Halyomorpha halys]
MYRLFSFRYRERICFSLIALVRPPWSVMLLPGPVERLQWPGSEECALEIISKSRPPDVFVWNHSDYFIKSLFILNISVTITNRLYFFLRTRPQYLAVSGTVKQLQELNYLNVSYNPLSITALVDGSLEEAEKLIFMFWSRKIYNVNAILNGLLLRSVHVGCGNYGIVKQRSCQFFSEQYLPYTECVFGINYVGREPNFIGPPNDGIEYLLLKLILNVCGINDIIWQKEKNFGSLENGTWTDALGNLEDLAAGGFMVSANRLNDFLMTYPHYFEKYVWFSPVPAVDQLWVGMGVVDFGGHLLVFIFMCCCFSLFSEGERMFSTPSLCLLNVLRVVLGQPIRRTPKNSPVRIIFISWVWYEMVFNSVMSGTLIKSLYNRRKVEVPLRNLARMSCLIQVVDEADSIEHNELCDVTQLAVGLAKHRNFTILAAAQPMKFITDKLHIPVKTIGKTFIRQLETFILPKYSPYYFRINRLISISFETGLIQKIMKEVESRHIFKKYVEIPEASTNMTLLFALFAGCYAACAVVFVLELTLFKPVSKRQGLVRNPRGLGSWGKAIRIG